MFVSVLALFWCWGCSLGLVISLEGWCLGLVLSLGVAVLLTSLSHIGLVLPGTTTGVEKRGAAMTVLYLH